MADYKRKPGESFESFLRRFKKALKNGKRLEQARSKQYRDKKPTKAKQRVKALTGLKLQKKNEYLRKTGKLVDNRY